MDIDFKTGLDKVYFITYAIMLGTVVNKSKLKMYIYKIITLLYIPKTIATENRTLGLPLKQYCFHIEDVKECCYILWKHRPNISSTQNNVQTINFNE